MGSGTLHMVSGQLSYGGISLMNNGLVVSLLCSPCLMKTNFCCLPFVCSSLFSIFTLCIFGMCVNYCMYFVSYHLSFRVWSKNSSTCFWLIYFCVSKVYHLYFSLHLSLVCYIICTLSENVYLLCICNVLIMHLDDFKCFYSLLLKELCEKFWNGVVPNTVTLCMYLYMCFLWHVCSHEEALYWQNAMSAVFFCLHVKRNTDKRTHSSRGSFCLMQTDLLCYLVQTRLLLPLEYV